MPDERELARRILRPRRHALPAAHRRHVHHRGLVAARQVRHREPRSVRSGPKKLTSITCRMISSCRVREVAPAPDAGVVDEQVEAAERGDRRIDEIAAVVRLRDVGRHGDDIAAATPQIARRVR